MHKATTIDVEEAASVALAALAWTLEDADRADRLLALTGLAPDDLRTRIMQPTVQAAILHFLESHEPDLIACADALQRRPDDLVLARTALERIR